MDRSTDDQDMHNSACSARPDESRREICERVMAAAWPLVSGPLVAHGVDLRSCVEREVDQRLRPVAEHMSYKVVPSDEEAFLFALPTLVTRDWLLARRACRSCRSWDWTRGSNVACPRLRRRPFVVVLERVPVEAWLAQRPDDDALGMPQLLSRRPRLAGWRAQVEGARQGAEQSGGR